MSSPRHRRASRELRPIQPMWRCPRLSRAGLHCLQNICNCGLLTGVKLEASVGVLLVSEFTFDVETDRFDRQPKTEWKRAQLLQLYERTRARQVLHHTSNALPARRIDPSVISRRQTAESATITPTNFTHPDIARAITLGLPCQTRTTICVSHVVQKLPQCVTHDRQVELAKHSSSTATFAKIVSELHNTSSDLGNTSRRIMCAAP